MPETVTLWPVLVQVAANVTLVNFFFSISLHLCLPTNYFDCAITVVFPGIVPSLPSRGETSSPYPLQQRDARGILELQSADAESLPSLGGWSAWIVI